MATKNIETGAAGATSPTGASERRWLTVPDAARHLGCAVHFVRSLLWDGEVSYVKAGKKFVIDAADLDDWAVRSKQRNGQ